MTVHEIILEIEQHGISLVMLIMIIVLWFIPWVKTMQEKSKREASPTDKEAKMFEDTVVFDMQITGILEELVKEFDAQWVVLWQFHNGVISTAGVPFMKMSVTHETAAPNYGTRGAPYVNIPISIFSEVLAALQKKCFLYVTADGKYSTMTAIYKKEEVNHGYYIKVTNERGSLIAVLSITYSTDTLIKDADIPKVKTYANRIAIMLGQLAVAYPKRNRVGDRH
jgi:hypothetical protein